MRFSRSAATVLFSCAALAQETFLVSMRDGVRLATDVYGAEAGVRKPVLLLRTPYDKKGGSATARRYAAAGYVAARSQHPLKRPKKGKKFG